MRDGEKRWEGVAVDAGGRNWLSRLLRIAKPHSPIRIKANFASSVDLPLLASGTLSHFRGSPLTIIGYNYQLHFCLASLILALTLSLFTTGILS